MAGTSENAGIKTGSGKDWRNVDTHGQARGYLLIIKRSIFCIDYLSLGKNQNYLLCKDFCKINSIFHQQSIWPKHRGLNEVLGWSNRQNINRHKLATKELQKMGWQVIIIWECEVGISLIKDIKKKLKHYAFGRINPLTPCSWSEKTVQVLPWLQGKM